MTRQKLLEELELRLQERKRRGLWRALRSPGEAGAQDPAYEFASNDYLSFARSPELEELTAKLVEEARWSGSLRNGSGGSRLLTGDSGFAHAVEKQIAHFHEAEACLLFNSGYDCNLGVFSCIAAAGRDVVLVDERVHASIHDGCRLSRARTVRRFRHNDLTDLRESLSTLRKALGDECWIFVGVESCYSMDGDLLARPGELLDMCGAFGALLIVDEAHSVGVHGPDGRGLLHPYRAHPALLARVVTFGKAFGLHGAAVLGAQPLLQYLLNYARPLIYSTSLPLHSLCAVSAAYRLMATETAAHRRKLLWEAVRMFYSLTRDLRSRCPQLPPPLVNRESPIQAIIIPGNENCVFVANELRQRGFDARPIRYPTVERGAERIRVVLHAHNTPEAINAFVQALIDIVGQLPSAMCDARGTHQSGAPLRPALLNARL
jgi:8-amino-7-oxononanoate synthase